jgi:hypothetical protein
VLKAIEVGSPLGGWVKLGPEHVPNPVTFILDILFFRVLIRLIWQVIRIVLGKEKPRRLSAMSPPLVLVLVIAIAGNWIEGSFASQMFPIAAG